MMFAELLPFSGNLTLQPQVSNFSTALVYHSKDNSVMLYVFLFGHLMHIENEVFSKILIQRMIYTCRKSEK